MNIVVSTSCPAIKLARENFNVNDSPTKVFMMRRVLFHMRRVLFHTARWPYGCSHVDFPFMAMMGVALLSLSRPLNGRTRTATFTEDMLLLSRSVVSIGWL